LRRLVAQATGRTGRQGWHDVTRPGTPYDRQKGTDVQRWGSGQAPASSVLLRTGALMSLASLGTAGLVLGGALAVGGPSGAVFPEALGSGPASITAGEPEPATVLVVSGRGPVARLDAHGTTRPAARQDGPRAPVGGTAGAGQLSGTTTSAVRAPADFDSVVHPARGWAVVLASPSPSPVPVAAAPAGPVAPAPGASTGRPAPQVAAPTAAVRPRPARPKAVPARAARAPRAVPAPRAARIPVIAKAPKVKHAVRVAPVAPPAPAAKPKTVPAAKPQAAKPQAAKPKAQGSHAEPEAAPAPHVEPKPAPAAHGNGGPQGPPKGETPGQAKGSGGKG
jgi:hypothetical protein